MMSDCENKHSATPAPPKLLLVRLLRVLMIVFGVGSTFFGIVFLITSIAFLKKEELFVRAELYAGLAFLVCGIALLTWIQRRLSDELRSAALQEADRDGMRLSVPPHTEVVGIGLIAVSLILPILTGIAQIFVTSFGISFAIGIAMVLATSVLVALDARSLGTRDLQGRKRESPGVLFLGMCLFWILFFPVAFFRRRHFGGPNLGPVAVAVALFPCVCPIVAPLVIPPSLPSCSSSEVVQLLDNIIRRSLVGTNLKSIDGHREISFDADAGVRNGECVAHTDAGEISVKFLVEWRDRNAGLFQVRTLPAELPSCISPEVVQLLEQVVRSELAGMELKTIDGHRENSFDVDAGVRNGECVAHTDAGEISLKFLVEWQDQDKGLFQVRVLPATLPTCMSPEVVQVLEQLIRTGLVDLELKSIDGHREISYDPDADVRTGECVAHTDAEEISIKFLVEWQDKDRGIFQVRTLDTPQ